MPKPGLDTMQSSFGIDSLTICRVDMYRLDEHDNHHCHLGETFPSDPTRPRWVPHLIPFHCTLCSGYPLYM